MESGHPSVSGQTAQNLAGLTEPNRDSDHVQAVLVGNRVMVFHIRREFVTAISVAQVKTIKICHCSLLTYQI